MDHCVTKLQSLKKTENGEGQPKLLTYNNQC